MLKEIGARIKHLVRFWTKTIAAPFKAAKASFGMGIGIGVNGAIKIKGTKVEGALSTSIIDSVSYDKGRFDIRNTKSTQIGLNIADLVDFQYSKGKEHSFFDENCNCSILFDSFEKQSNCPASTSFQQEETIVGITIGVYLGVGFEVTIGIDYGALNDDLIDIFTEPYVGYY